MAKLTEKQVGEIFSLLSCGKCSSRAIADRFGVSESDIDRIRTGRLWSHAQPAGWKKPRLLTKAGELHSKAEITEIQAIEILRRSRSGERITALAAEFGLHYTTVYDIREGRSWKHLE
ncbi:MAG: hypothetical protein ABIK08_11485 [Pseudomonadota bacterium]